MKEREREGGGGVRERNRERDARESKRERNVIYLRLSKLDERDLMKPKRVRK